MVSVLASSVVNRCSSPDRVKSKTMTLRCVAFTAKHAILREKMIDWLARIQACVSEGGAISVSELALLKSN
jgi:UDP-N-acetylglucosamine:LPS N-acetylglucosamine transferase